MNKVSSHSMKQKRMPVRCISWMEEGVLFSKQETKLNLAGLEERNLANNHTFKDSRVFWESVVRNTIPDILIGTVLLCLTLLVQEVLSMYWSPYEVRIVLCICTCSLTMTFFFHYAFVREHHFEFFFFFLSFAFPSMYLCGKVSESLDIEDIWRGDPVLGILKSSFARAFGFFAAYTFHAVGCFSLKKYAVKGAEKNRKSHPSHLYNTSTESDRVPNPYTGKSKSRSSSRRALKTLRDVCFYGFVMSLLLLFSSFVSTIGYAWKPAIRIEQQVWSVAVSGIFVPWCAIGFKWAVAMSLTKISRVARVEKKKSKKLAMRNLLQMMLVSSKSVELFFNLVKVAIIIVMPDTQDAVIVGSMSVLAQIATVIVITIYTSHSKESSKLWHHSDMALHLQFRSDETPVVGWRKLFGVASMSRHPSLYQGFSLWSCVLVHEYHANLAAVIISFIYLAFRDQYALASLSLRACFLIAAYSAKMAALHKILPHCMPSDKRLCSSLYSAHGLMPSLATRAGALVWLVCSIPFLVQGELHHTHSKG